MSEVEFRVKLFSKISLGINKSPARCSSMIRLFMKCAKQLALVLTRGYQTLIFFSDNWKTSRVESLPMKIQIIVFSIPSVLSEVMKGGINSSILDYLGK